MYEVVFYQDKNGKEPVNEYLQDLAQQKGKDSRIKLNKIRDYVKALSLYGTTIGEPYMKHLEGEIWELRPIRDRILFVAMERKQISSPPPFYEKDTENSWTGNRTG
jgi:phage-related protein